MKWLASVPHRDEAISHAATKPSVASRDARKPFCMPEMKLIRRIASRIMLMMFTFFPPYR